MIDVGWHPQRNILAILDETGATLRFAEVGEVRHAMVSTIKTGVSPEGLAVSPGGKWVVATNLERSYLPYNAPRITW